MKQTLIFYINLFFITLYHGARAVLHKGKNRRDFDENNSLTWARRLLQQSGVQIEADLSSITPGGHYVFIGNHQSNIDIPSVMHILSDHPIRFVAKESLFKIPVFGPALAASGHIPINRGNSRQAIKSLNEAAKKAQEGVCPFIFPEGTRNKDITKLMDFKIGAVLLALKCKLPVVPVVIAGTGKYLPTKHVMVHPEEIVKIKTLEPIDPNAYSLKDREQFRQDLYDKMNKAYIELMETR
ncbi:MAG: lysophospholipid acyltransferase family protein [Desulfovibrio sp.]